MKILHVINNLNSGGAENLLKEVVPLQNEQYSTDILMLSDKNNVFEEELLKKNVKLYNTKISDNVYNPMQIIEILKYIKNYDLIHVHLFPSFYWTAIANIFLFNKKKKLILTEHNTSNNRRNKIIFKYIDRFIYKKYDKVICISEATKNELKKWLDKEDSDINNYFEVINNGINLEKFKVAKSYNKKKIISTYKSEDVILCMVGRFNKQKDHDTVIRTLAKLPENYKLVLVGEGERLEEIKSLANDLNVLERITFMGFRKDIENILKTCDINILSSYYEGFGLSAVESMACGIPTIASDVDGLKDVVDDGGVIFEVGNYEDLLKKILDITTDKKKYENIKQMGIDKSRIYCIYNMIDSINQIYEKNKKY